jgi:hypothetical protein
MWLGIAVLMYVVGVILLIRFFQTVHQWDEEIESMENQPKRTRKRKTIQYRPAA